MLRQDLKPFRPTKEEMKESYIQEMYGLIIKKPNDNVYNFALNKLLSIFLYMFSEKEKKLTSSNVSIIDYEDLDMVIATTVYKSLFKYNQNSKTSFCVYASKAIQRELFKEYKTSLPYHIPDKKTEKTKREIETKLQNFKEVIISIDSYRCNDDDDNEKQGFDLLDNSFENTMNNILMKQDLLLKLRKIPDGNMVIFYYGLENGQKKSVKEVALKFGFTPRVTDRRIKVAMENFKLKYPQYYNDWYAA